MIIASTPNIIATSTKTHATSGRFGIKGSEAIIDPESLLKVPHHTVSSIGSSCINATPSCAYRLRQSTMFGHAQTFCAPTPGISGGTQRRPLHAVLATLPDAQGAGISHYYASL